MGLAADVLYTLSEPFYALHTAVFLSYFLVRHAAASYSSDVFRLHLFRREVQALLSLAVLLCLKWRTSLSTESFLGDCMLYGKGVLLLLATILDRRLAAWYMICFAVMFLIRQQPTCKALGNVVHMTPLQLEEYLGEGNAGKTWLVEFRAVWSTQCIKASRVFTNLSTRYSTQDLYFGSVDLGKFPKAGEVYEISSRVTRGQLPTYIMFKGGSEVSRLSNMDSDGNTVFSHPLSEHVIATYFELDRHIIFELDKLSPKK